MFEGLGWDFGLKRNAGERSVDDEELLDEVTNLVEYPNAIECSFDEEFLEIPSDVIEMAMKED